MDKTNRTEIQRLFLLDALPEPLTRASSHVQIFDNYIRDTRLRLRSVRDPETREWVRILQQRFAASGDLTCIKLSEIYLDEREYGLFKQFEGNEIRKNRYFHEFDTRVNVFDLFLGPLWGLIMAKVGFTTVDDARAFEPPPFALFEVTSSPLFDGASLVTKDFDDIRREVGKLDPLVKGLAHAAGD